MEQFMTNNSQFLSWSCSFSVLDATNSSNTMIGPLAKKSK